MKRVMLYTKEVSPRDGKHGTEVQRVTVSSIDMYKFALESNQENVRGIEKLVVVGGVIRKIDDSGDWVDLEDAEFEILKNSVDSVTFPPVVLYFQEMFSAIKEASDPKGLGLSTRKPGEIIKEGKPPGDCKS